MFTVVYLINLYNHLCYGVVRFPFLLYLAVITGHNVLNRDWWMGISIPSDTPLFFPLSLCNVESSLLHIW